MNHIIHKMKLIVRILPNLGRVLYRDLRTSFVLKSDSQFTGNHTSDRKNEEKNERALPPEPTHCCNTGCPNCVWIKYAQELAQMYDDGDVLARKKITEKVKDHKLREFLFTQLGMKENKERPEKH